MSQAQLRDFSKFGFGLQNVVKKESQKGESKSVVFRVGFCVVFRVSFCVVFRLGFCVVFRVVDDAGEYKMSFMETFMVISLRLDSKVSR